MKQTTAIPLALLGAGVLVGCADQQQPPPLEPRAQIAATTVVGPEERFEADVSWTLSTQYGNLPSTITRAMRIAKTVRADGTWDLTIYNPSLGAAQAAAAGT